MFLMQPYMGEVLTHVRDVSNGFTPPISNLSRFENTVSTSHQQLL